MHHLLGPAAARAAAAAARPRGALLLLTLLLLPAAAAFLPASLAPAPPRKSFSPSIFVRMSVEGSPLKIRSVTSFVSLPQGVCSDAVSLAKHLSRATGTNARMRAALEEAGYEVQTTRVAANPFGEWLSVHDPTALEPELETLHSALTTAGVAFFNCGPALDLTALSAVPRIIVRVPSASASADLLPSRDPGRADAAWMEAVAECCITVGRETEGGIGNFRFCASAHTDPGVPFFPAAYHSKERPEGFAIALENGGVFYAALAEASGGGLNAAFEGERRGLGAHLLEIQRRAMEVAEKEGAAYLGIDTSVNPSLSEDGSVAGACERFYGGGYKFGHTGTLALAEMLTRSVRDIDGIRTTGYCGLMLPVLEDVVLARRTAEGVVTVGDLLRFSSVCGVGLDTVPVSGFVDKASLSRTYADVTALAVKLKKPLTVRLFPVQGSREGEEVDLRSPFMCKSLILPLT